MSQSDRRVVPWNKRHSHTIKAITKTCFLELKRVWKLCDNKDPKNKKDHPKYNPCYKYDSIFDTIVHNVNAITLYAGLDLVGDESSFAHQGYGEAGAGNVFTVLNKPSVSKGMQSVIVTDVEYLRPRAYLHRHKLNKKFPGFGPPGPNEVRQLWESQLRELTRPSNSLVGRPIFSQKPHMTFDNFFSGEAIMEYAAEEGFGFTSTVARNRLPKGVPEKFWCKGKTGSTQRSKHARYENPVFAIKEHAGSTMAITSFQSTSSCNFGTVNALNRSSRYCATKERGRKQKKFSWGIEMNEARELYLKTYGTIDKLDHLIKNCNMHYRSWKYWHSAMLHAKAMAICVAYDIYRECATGKLNPAWKLAAVVD